MAAVEKGERERELLQVLLLLLSRSRGLVRFLRLLLARSSSGTAGTLPEGAASDEGGNVAAAAAATAAAEGLSVKGVSTGEIKERLLGSERGLPRPATTAAAAVEGCPFPPG